MKKFKKFLTRNNKKLIVACSAGLILFALINIYFVVEVNIISNDECLWVSRKVSDDSTAIFFDHVKYKGVTWNAGIRNGDQLLKINDTPLPHVEIASKVLNEVREGDYAKYLVKSNGKIFTTNIYIKKLFVFPVFAQCLLGFFWILIGFVVLMAKPNGTIQKLFYGIGAALVLAASISILQAYTFIEKLPLGALVLIVISYLWSVSTCYLPFLMIYFFWVFPKKFKFIEKKSVIASLFIIPGIFSLFTFAIILLTFGFHTLDYTFFNTLITILTIIGAVINLAAYISLIINYKRLETKEEKKPVFIILGAFTLAMTASLYTSLVAPAITDTVFNSPEFYTPIILVSIFPLAFAYAIFKYQLMDVSVVIKNTITYGAATLSIAAIYFLVIYVIGQGLSQVITGAAEYQGIIAGVLFIVFALVFQSTKERCQDFITAKFYPEQLA